MCLLNFVGAGGGGGSGGDTIGGGGSNPASKYIYISDCL